MHPQGLPCINQKRDRIGTTAAVSLLTAKQRPAFRQGAILLKAPGAGVERALERPQKRGIFREARLLRRLHHRHALANQLSRPKQALLYRVLVDGGAKL